MRAVLVISERDNVATALEALEPGRRIDAGSGLEPIHDGVTIDPRVAS